MMPGTGSDTNLSVSLIILFGSAAIVLPVVVFSGRVLTPATVWLSWMSGGVVLHFCGSAGADQMLFTVFCLYVCLMSHLCETLCV